MSLLVVTVKDSANADSGSARTSKEDSATIVFLSVNEPAAVSNLLLPSITFGIHYIRNAWNDRSTFLKPKTCKSAAGAAANRLKRNAAGQINQPKHCTRH
jgi:hypothetical protein